VGKVFVPLIFGNYIQLDTIVNQFVSVKRLFFLFFSLFSFLRRFDTSHPTKNFTAFIKYIESKLGRPIILEKYNSNLVNHAIEDVGRLHGQLPNEKHSESDFYHYIFSRWKTNFEYISTPLHNKINSGIRLFGLTLPVQFSLHDGKRLVEELNHLPEFR